MDIKFKNDFAALWKKFFGDAELPITFYYTNEEGHAELAKPNTIPRCIIAALKLVRNGKPISLDVESIGCWGGKRYLGFSETVREGFEYFLSCGIPGKMEGERYKKTPEIAAESVWLSPKFTAPGKFAVLKRWDLLDESDKPEVVVFFATPDVLSGLFTLANFDEVEPNGVLAPFGSACSTILQSPFLEKDSARPRAFIGLFDVSARPFASENILTFSVPMRKFEHMVANMEESFLITNSWKIVQKRIQKSI